MFEYKLIRPWSVGVLAVFHHIVNFIMVFFSLLAILIIVQSTAENKSGVLFYPIFWLVLCFILFLGIKGFWKGRSWGRKIVLYVDFAQISIAFIRRSYEHPLFSQSELVAVNNVMIEIYLLGSIFYSLMAIYILVSKNIRAYYNPNSAVDHVFGTMKKGSGNPEYETIHCPYCNKLISKTAKFCHNCGKILSDSFQNTDVICGNCKKYIHKDALFCWNCGEGIP